MNHTLALILLLPALTQAAELPCELNPADALVFDGVTFALGNRAFADRVVRYRPGAGVGPEYSFANTAIGMPNWADGVGAVSLGYRTETQPAALVLGFTQAAIFNGPGADLYVFEVGPVVEATDVSLSVDGRDWVSVGRIEGATRAIDLDDVPGFQAGTAYRYIKLVNAGGRSSAPYAGADIDAVGIMGACPAPREI